MDGSVSGVTVDAWLLSFSCGFLECARYTADDVFTVSMGVGDWR